MTDATEEQIKLGTTVYDRAGHKAEYVQPVAGGHLVRPIMTVWAGGGDDVWEEDAASESLDIWTQVYRKPPTLELHEEAAKLAEEIAEAHRKLNEIRGQAVQAERENDAMLKRLARYEPLQHLEAIMAGEVPYIVEASGNGFVIKTWAEAVIYRDDYDRKDKMRLMVLKPDPNGSISWHLSKYADGSGTAQSCYPATSLEEAQVIAVKLIEDMLGASYITFEEHAHLWVSAEANLTKQGIAVPEDIASKAQIARKAAAAKQLTAAEAALVKAREAVDAAKAATKKVT